MQPETLQIIQTLGALTPASIFAMMWYLERADRLKLQTKVYDMGREVVAAITETKTSLAVLGNIFDGNSSSKRERG